MKNLKDTCINFFHHEDTKNNIKEIFTPFVDIVYNELYIYLWIFCFFNIILFGLIVANIYLAVKLFKYILNNSPYN